MTTFSNSLIYEETINVTPDLIYQAFTNATILREFMCQVASVNPKIGGRVYLAWDNDYYMAGEYTKLDEDKEIAFTWSGRGDPGATEVTVRLSTSNGSTQINVTHAGLGEGEAWEKAADQWRKGWSDCLENLKSTLETGEDLRITQRPMVGIMFGEFNEQVAKKLGVPVSEGVRLGGVVEGLSAQRIGLKKDDVVVEMDSTLVKEWSNLGPILQKKSAGEEVNVVYYRGPERNEAIMSLAKRPIPEIPWTVAGLAAEVRKRNQVAFEHVKEFLNGVTDKEAEFKPAPDEWSIKEVMAHLIQGEQYLQFYVLEIIGAQERWSDDYAGNEEVMFKGTLALHPTINDLIEAFDQVYMVTGVMVSALPVDFPQNRKGSYWRLAYNWLQPEYHIQDHLGQMQDCLRLARGE